MRERPVIYFVRGTWNSGLAREASSKLVDSNSKIVGELIKSVRQVDEGIDPVLCLRFYGEY